MKSEEARCFMKDANSLLLLINQSEKKVIWFIEGDSKGSVSIILLISYTFNIDGPMIMPSWIKANFPYIFRILGGEFVSTNSLGPVWVVTE